MIKEYELMFPRESVKELFSKILKFNQLVVREKLANQKFRRNVLATVKEMGKDIIQGRTYSEMARLIETKDEIIINWILELHTKDSRPHDSLEDVTESFIFSLQNTSRGSLIKLEDEPERLLLLKKQLFGLNPQEIHNQFSYEYERFKDVLVELFNDQGRKDKKPYLHYATGFLQICALLSYFKNAQSFIDFVNHFDSQFPLLPALLVNDRKLLDRFSNRTFSIGNKSLRYTDIRAELSRTIKSHKWIRNDKYNEFLSELYEKKRKYFGIALMCDAIKELGFRGYPKLDRYLNSFALEYGIVTAELYRDYHQKVERILNQRIRKGMKKSKCTQENVKNSIWTNPNKYALCIYTSVVRFAKESSVDVFQLDKLIWLAISRYHYRIESQKKDKKTQPYRDEFFKFLGAPEKYIKTDSN